MSTPTVSVLSAFHSDRISRYRSPFYDARVATVVDYFGGLPAPLVEKVKTLPPTLILHGDADKVVPISEAKALEKLCQERKFIHEVWVYPGAGHGFFGVTGQDAMKRSLSFLDVQLKHAKPSSTSAQRVRFPGRKRWRSWSAGGCERVLIATLRRERSRHSGSSNPVAPTVLQKRSISFTSEELYFGGDCDGRSNEVFKKRNSFDRFLNRFAASSCLTT